MSSDLSQNGGEGGIRTPGSHPTTVFKTAALNRSATSPRLKHHIFYCIVYSILYWYARQGSNLRPLGPQPSALSAELRALKSLIKTIKTGGETGIRTREETLRSLTRLAGERLQPNSATSPHNFYEII